MNEIDLNSREPVAERAIFIHIPKTAGSSFAERLREAYPKQDIISVSWSSWFNGVNDVLLQLRPFGAKVSARLLAGHQPYGNHRYLSGSWTYITFMREPVERALSHYYFLTKDGSYAKLPDILGQSRLVWNNIPFHYLFDNFQTRFLSNNIFGACYPSGSAMLGAAIENLNNIHVGLTEEFSLSVRYFECLLNLPADAAFESKKVSNRRALGAGDLYEKVKEHNGLDRVLYEYAKVKFNEQLQTCKL
jgi:hypothetical protein